jgi:hypothetical protein
MILEKIVVKLCVIIELIGIIVFFPGSSLTSPWQLSLIF